MAEAVVVELHDGAGSVHREVVLNNYGRLEAALELKVLKEIKEGL